MNRRKFCAILMTVTQKWQYPIHQSAWVVIDMTHKYESSVRSFIRTWRKLKVTATVFDIVLETGLNQFEPVKWIRLVAHTSFVRPQHKYERLKVRQGYVNDSFIWLIYMTHAKWVILMGEIKLIGSNGDWLFWQWLICHSLNSND